MVNAVLAGSTGLVGSHILQILLANSSVSSVHAFTRRELPNPTASSKLHSLDTTAPFPNSPVQNIFISALGTTRAQAGGLEAQRKIDVDLNYTLAKAAKDAGVETYILISSTSANSKSRLPYSQMKGELEDKVTALGFKHTIILRPGLIVGTREDSRPAEFAFRAIANGLGKVSSMLVDPWAQDVEVIARAAVNAGLEATEGKRKEGAEVLGQKDIVALGRKK